MQKGGSRERREDCAYRGFRRPRPDPKVRRAALSSDPSVDGGCTVMVLLAAEEAVFCKPSDASWRTLAFAPGAFSAVTSRTRTGRSASSATTQANSCTCYKRRDGGKTESCTLQGSSGRKKSRQTSKYENHDTILKHVTFV